MIRPGELFAPTLIVPGGLCQPDQDSAGRDVIGRRVVLVLKFCRQPPSCILSDGPGNGKDSQIQRLADDRSCL
jgi:hypothetical protein